MCWWEREARYGERYGESFQDVILLIFGNDLTITSEYIGWDISPSVCQSICVAGSAFVVHKRLDSEGKTIWKI